MSAWLFVFLHTLIHFQGFLTAVLQSYARKNKIAIDSLCYDYKVTSHWWCSPDTSSDKWIDISTMFSQVALSCCFSSRVYDIKNSFHEYLLLNKFSSRSLSSKSTFFYEMIVTLHECNIWQTLSSFIEFQRSIISKSHAQLSWIFAPGDCFR